MFNLLTESSVLKCLVSWTFSGRSSCSLILYLCQNGFLVWLFSFSFFLSFEVKSKLNYLLATKLYTDRQGHRSVLGNYDTELNIKIMTSHLVSKSEVLGRSDKRKQSSFAFNEVNKFFF